MKQSCLFLCCFLWASLLFNFHPYPHSCLHSYFYSCAVSFRAWQLSCPHWQGKQKEYKLSCKKKRFTWWKSNSLNIHFLQDIGNNILYGVASYFHQNKMGTLQLPFVKDNDGTNSVFIQLNTNSYCILHKTQINPGQTFAFCNPSISTQAYSVFTTSLLHHVVLLTMNHLNPTLMILHLKM